MTRNYIILLFCITLLPIAGVSQTTPDTNRVLYGWMLDDNFVTPELVNIDTSLSDYQQHNIVFKKYNSVSTLGSNGSPYLSNLYFLRDDLDDLLFLNSYIDYFSTYSNTTYFNTKKPFSHLEYIQSYPESDREHTLNVFLTQNINDKWNWGFDINVINDKSQYKYQNTNNKAFNVFSSFSGKNYSMHLSLNLDKYLAGESAGVTDSSYFYDGWQFTKEVETNFTGGEGSGSQPYAPHVTTKIRYMDAMLSQSFKLFIGNTKDSLKTSSTIAQPALTHIIKARRASKIYENSEAVNNLYYNNNFSNWSETYDSIAETKITNTLQFDFKTKLKRNVIAGVYANINHDFVKYSYYSLLDTSLVDSVWLNQIDTAGLSPEQLQSTQSRYIKDGITNYDSIYDINNTTSLYNLYLSAGIYGRFWTHFKSRFNATIYFAGYKAGQTKIDGLLQSSVNILKRPYGLSVAGSIENTVPSYQLSNYYSNNYIWEKDFKSMNRLFLSGKLTAPSNGFEVDGYYTLLSNYIYMSDSMPEVYNKPLNVWAMTVQKEFVLWKFHSFNKLTYQMSENRNVLELPSIVFFNSTYIDHTWRFKMTNGKLRTMFGVDIYYNSRMDGYGYSPAMAMFYPESRSTVGAYPFVDVWLNIRLKRTRFFLKYEHVNDSKENLNHFYANHYPSKTSALKIGISWTFYD